MREVFVQWRSKGEASWGTWMHALDVHSGSTECTRTRKARSLRRYEFRLVLAEYTTKGLLVDVIYDQEGVTW